MGKYNSGLYLHVHTHTLKGKEITTQKGGHHPKEWRLRDLLYKENWETTMSAFYDAILYDEGEIRLLQKL